MRGYFVIVFIFFTVIHTKSQIISNIIIDQIADKVIISYDLLGNAGIALQLSKDGYNFISIKASGDIGSSVIEGKSKKIFYTPDSVLMTDNCIFRIYTYPFEDNENLVDLRDGRSYKITAVRDQVWMAENLNFYTETGSFCYNNYEDNCKKYGRLYTWETAQKICPKGWRLPSEEDWDRLIQNLGGEDVAGRKMKSQTGWDQLGNGNNKSGFNGFPSGNRYHPGEYKHIGKFGSWWSSSNATYYSLFFESDDVEKYSFQKLKMSLSVRCIKGTN